MTSRIPGSVCRLIILSLTAAALGCGARTGFWDRHGGGDSGAVCGNRLLEPGEDCDSDLLQGETCESLGYAGGVLHCTATCRLDASDCIAPADCGNGTIEGGEDCDGANLGGRTCVGLGFAGGDLSCAPFCRFDTDDCRRATGCGDGIEDPGEECDDGNLVPCDGCDQDCRGERCGNGRLDCDEFCDDGNTVDGDGCASSCIIEDVCGNGIAEPGVGEECDGGDLAGASCLDDCYTGGVMSCAADCTLDFSRCTGGPVCGNGIIECDEACDGDDLNGRTCSSIGYTGGGDLACGGGCQYDVSDCTGQLRYFYEDFEDPAGASASWSLTGDWEVGAPGSHWAEPAQAFFSMNCLATMLGDSYSNNQDFFTSMAVSPVIDLAIAASPMLTFQLWLSVVGSDGMNCWVRREGDPGWTLLADPIPPYDDEARGEPVWTSDTTGWNTWNLMTVDLSAYAGDRIQLGFGFGSNGSDAKFGAYVDDVLVSEP
ncbi:MAG: DUF4215 domain-containing protein [Pseudomonadota bacterium]